ncbi:MAG: hypothetical protein ACSHX3_07845 [Litorimonas sp.]
MDKVFGVLVSAVLLTGWIWIFGQTDSVYIQAGMIVFSILGGCLMASQSDDEHDVDEDVEMMS